MKVRPHPDIPGALTFAHQERPDGWVEDLPADPEKPTRTLYHYTSQLHLPMILEGGIARGDVSLTPETGYNAPWLTDDEDFHKQGWAHGGVDKTKVRLSVDIPATSSLLHWWPEMAKAEGVPDFWYRTLDRVGSGGSNHWYVFKGHIPKTWISGITMRQDISLQGKWGIKAKPAP